MEQHRTRIDPQAGVLIIAGLKVDNAEVLRECRHWSKGQRGAPVEIAELAAADLATFAAQAVTVGATAMAAAAGVQERFGVEESLVAEAEKRSTPAATSAAERTEAAVTQASTALRQSSETKKAVVEAGLTAREAFTCPIETARIDLAAQLTTLLVGDELELAVRLQPVLERFGRTMEQRSVAQLDTLVRKVAKQFDPAEPSSPMAQQIRVLTETRAAHAVAAAEQQRLLADKLEVLSTGVQVAKATKVVKATQVVLAKSAAKGAMYEEQVHACLAEIAAGLGDEYVQTGNVVGLRMRSKKGGGLLAVTGTDASVVVETTDSPRTTRAAYLREAEDNVGRRRRSGSYGRRSSWAADQCSRSERAGSSWPSTPSVTTSTSCAVSFRCSA